MKIKYIIRTFLIVSIFVIGFQSINAQYAYGLSDIVYDPVSKKVTTTSITSLDFWAGLHYDPAVVGDVYEEGTRVGLGYSAGFAHIVDADVRMRSINPAPPNTRYDIYSDHYIIAYYYTEVIILDDETEIPQIVQQWYDPLGFSNFGAGQNPGWYEFGGSENNSTFSGSRHFYLGTTGKGLITPSEPTCSDGSAVVGDSCPDDLTVEIKNRFKGQTDFVELRTDVSSSSDDPTTYLWKINGNVDQQNDSTSANFTNYYDKIGDNTASVTVTQGNQSVTKSFTINSSLPELVNLSSIPNGFYGKQRQVNVTNSNNLCGFQSASIQTLILGCPNVFPIDNTSDSSVGGFFQAAVSPPEGYISNGNRSFVEFFQIIKPTRTRYGDANSGPFIECAEFNGNSSNPPSNDPSNADGWRTDFIASERGGDVINGIRVGGSFRNNQTGTNNQLKLKYLDSPSQQLLNINDNVDELNRYIANDRFVTYITYSTDTFGNRGEDFRKSIAKIDWSWRGDSKKINSVWQLEGSSPQNELSLTNEPIQFSPTSTGERPYSGRLDADFSGWQSCSIFPPITITTPANVAVWRRDNGVWWVVKPDGTTQAVQWGVDYDIPVPGDYDGDGLADFAVFRPDDPATSQDECAGGCVWYVLKSSDGNWQPSYFGSKDDKPTPADFDGDGLTDVAVFRPSTNTWHIMRSSDNSYYNVVFGNSTDTPVPSDYDGDGIDDLAMWSATTATWSVKNSSDQTTTTQQWGTYTDVPVIGDYDGDGKTDFANWQSNGDWLILLSADGQIKTENFGVFSSDIPVPGNYDGDDKTDIAVWRPNASQASEWFIKRSSDNQVEVRFWGLAGDIPIPAAYSR